MTPLHLLGGPDVLAIVGSGQWPFPDLLAVIVREEIEEYVRSDTPGAIVSGRAAGVDSVAELVATQWGIPFIGHEPANRRWQPEGFKERNLLIVRDCTRLLSVRNSQSRTYGSGWTADEAQRRGKPVLRWMVHPNGRIERLLPGETEWH